MVYPTDEETFDARNTPEFIKEGHLNSIQAFLKRIQDFLGYGGRISDKYGVIVPPGVIFPYAAEVAPTGFLLCDGMAYSSTGSGYTDLFGIIGYKFGEHTGNRFCVPDTRGQFIRGWDNRVSVPFTSADVNIAINAIELDATKLQPNGTPVRFTTSGTLPAPFVINTTYYTITEYGNEIHFATTRANAIIGTAIPITTVGAGSSNIIPYPENDDSTRLAMTKGGNTGANLGSWQDDAFQKHYHKVEDVNNWSLYAAANMASGTLMVGRRATSWSTTRFNAKDIYSDGSFPTPRETTETRTKNLYINHIIKR